MAQTVTRAADVYSPDSFFLPEYDYEPVLQDTSISS